LNLTTVAASAPMLATAAETLHVLGGRRQPLLESLTTALA
jgi:hypothetical protein